MDTLWSFVTTSVEVQGFGKNILTVGAIGAVILTFIQAWGIWSQVVTLWDRSKRAQSVSLSMNAYYHAFMWSFILYGVYEHSLTMVANGLIQAPLFLLVLVGILRARGFSRTEWAITFGLLFTLCALMFFAPDHKVLMFPLLGIGIGFAVMQPWVMWRTKTSGAVNVRFAITYAMSSVFWTALGVALGDHALMYLNPIGFVVFTTTIVLYWRYRASPVTVAPV